MVLIEIDPHQRLVSLVTRYPNQKAAAAALGITQQYLNDLIHQRRGFSERVLTKLGLKRVVVKA